MLAVSGALPRHYAYPASDPNECEAIFIKGLVPHIQRFWVVADGFINNFFHDSFWMYDPKRGRKQLRLPSGGFLKPMGEQEFEDCPAPHESASKRIKGLDGHAIPNEPERQAVKSHMARPRNRKVRRVDRKHQAQMDELNQHFEQVLSAMWSMTGVYSTTEQDAYGSCEKGQQLDGADQPNES